MVKTQTGPKLRCLLSLPLNSLTLEINMLGLASEWVAEVTRPIE